jgi:hypothetical protein
MDERLESFWQVVNHFITIVQSLRLHGLSLERDQSLCIYLYLNIHLFMLIDITFSLLYHVVITLHPLTM